VGSQHHALNALSEGKRSVTHCTGSWLSPTACLDRCRKYHPPNRIRSPYNSANSKYILTKLQLQLCRWHH